MTNKILTGIVSTLSYIDKVLIYAGQKLIYHFPNKDFYKLDNLVFKEEEMGESIITCDLSIPADVDPAFSFDWYIELKGEKFYNKTLLPPARKNTESLKYVYSMTFVSERHDLQRDPFANLVTTSEEQPRTEYVFSFYADITQFADRFNLNLAACLGDRWTMVVSDGVTSSTELISCDNIKLWDLLKSVYDIYGLRWRIYYDADLDKMVIRILNETTDAIEIDHEFEYGANNGLIEIERLNPTEKITTRLSGRGGTRNIPPSYFHDAISGYPADPDANIHTKATYYTNLMPKCYRDYVKGWNGTALSPETPAYTQGVADKVLGIWNPVDYIDSANLPVYGRWKDVLEDNTEIYPTIQGITDPVLGRLDEVVDVEAVLNDDYDEDDDSDTGHYNDIPVVSLSQFCNPSETPSNNVVTSAFVIDNAVNKTSFNIVQTPNIIGGNDIDYSSQITISLLDESTHAVVDTVVFNGVMINPNIKALYFDGVFSNEPLGTYILQLEVQVTNGDYTINVTTELNTIKVYNYANPDTLTQYKQTFDIWVKNIWGSTYQDTGYETETPAEYASRIWDALTPTNLQGEMTVMWSSGLLASEDYEFIVHEINYDTSKTNSHWRLTLIKSDAELEATDKYLPNKNINAVAGNYFFFTNIILPQTYVLSAETNVENYISAELAKVDTELPTYSAKPSKIFCASFSEIDKLRVGSRIRLKDTRLIGATSAGYYISSLTMTYTKESILPDWEIIITDKVSSVGNSISRLEGDVKRLSNGIYSNEQQATILAKQFDRYFLRKDGLSQSSESPTTFNKDVTITKNLLSGDFRQGELTGDGFGLFRDASGNSVIEVDRMNVRKTLTVNELIINQVTFYGGKYLYSAAGMESVKVEDTGTAYRVYMDTKQGTRLNQFVVNDQAFCQRFAPTDNTIINYYWRLVTAVGSDYIELSKSDYDTGSGIPQVGDNIAQVGNRVVTNRQSVLIIDQLTGGSVVQYAGIDGYSWTDKNYVGYGVNPSTGQAYLYCYGDMYIGDRDIAAEDSTWLTFQKKFGDDKRKLYLKGQMIFTEDSSGLYNLSEWPDVDQRIKDAAAYKINLTPDNTSVPCTSEGVVIGDLPTSQAEVYTGSILDTGWAFTGIFDGCEGTVGLSTGLITITALSADSAKVTISATKTGKPVLTAIFGITKVRAGGDGQTTVIYSANPSVNVIKISKSGVITPTTITCDKLEQAGNFPPVITTEKILKYQVSGGSVTSYTGAITIVNTWNYIDFILYDTDGTTILDKERVPIVRDGGDGVYMTLIPTKQVFNYDANGTLADSGAWFVWATVYNAPSGTLYYEWIINDISVQNGQYSGYSLVPPSDFDDMPVSYEVKVRLGGTSGTMIASAKVSITGQKPGQPGNPGDSSYLHIAWANDELGTDFSTTTSANRAYIGTYTDNNPTGSQNYADYSWTLIKGTPGADGTDGIPINYEGVFSAVKAYHNVLYRSLVMYSGAYYAYIGTNGASGAWNASNWQYWGANFSHIATGVLFAERATIDNLYVKDFEGVAVPDGNIYGTVTTITANSNPVARQDRMTINGNFGEIDITCENVTCTFDYSTGFGTFVSLYYADYYAANVILSYSGNTFIFTAKTAGTDFVYNNTGASNNTGDLSATITAPYTANSPGAKRKNRVEITGGTRGGTADILCGYVARSIVWNENGAAATAADFAAGQNGKFTLPNVVVTSSGAYIYFEAATAGQDFETTFTETTNEYQGAIFIQGNDVWEGLTNSSAGGVIINRRGYNGGMSQYRQFGVFDGKGNLLMNMFGTDLGGSINLWGNSVKAWKNFTVGQKLSLTNIPTSATGLSSGDVWRDGTTLKIVP
jgi:hypothetical protein